MGHAHTLTNPGYGMTLRGTYVPPAECSECCTRAPGYCCGWIEYRGLSGGAPNLSCNVGGFNQLAPRGRKRH